jgi:malonate decarboxylase gamma subunit
MEWDSVAERLFDRGHDIVATGDLLSGIGHCGDTTFAVVGSTNHAEIGVELTLAMAKRVIETMRDHPSRPILFLIDTQGQRLRHRDELLGLHHYMAHLAQCGGFLASGMMADLCAALPGAEIRVMNLAAMARVTRLPEERLTALAKTSPVFAPGAANYVQMGAVDALWDGDLAARLAAALRDASSTDTRRELGRARGGRELAAAIAERAAAE